MSPQEALAEIAFRLERQRAEPFRIQAFRRAAAAIADASEDEPAGAAPRTVGWRGRRASAAAASR